MPLKFSQMCEDLREIVTNQRFGIQAWRENKKLESK